jgi:hypothetical protein
MKNIITIICAIIENPITGPVDRTLDVGVGFSLPLFSVSAKNFSLYVCKIFRRIEVSGKSGRQYRIYVHCDI